MWWMVLLLILVALVTIKLVKLSLFWSSYGIPYEPLPRYLYRIVWQFNTQVVNDVIRDTVARYGSVFGSYHGLRPSLIVTDMEIAKEVLIKQFNNFFKRNMEFSTGDPLWDNIVLNLPYNEWKCMRTVMGYTFTTSKMRGMIPKFDKIAKRLVNKLEVSAQSSENVVVLKSNCRAYSIDSMTAVSFGLDPNSIENPDNAFMKYAGELSKPGLSVFLFVVAPKLMKYIPFVDFPPKNVSNFFGSVAKQSLDEKRQKLEEVIANGTADIIDLHLIAQREDAKNTISDEMLASQAFIFLLASLEGVTITLEFTAYFFAVNPDVQQKAYDELTEIMQERTDLTYGDINKLKYLEACLLETLRLAPVITFFDRICSADTEVHGLKIPKGMTVAFPLAAIHRDPKYFPEPERYMPERFLKGDEVAEEQDISAFLIFGAGPKVCVGRRLALMNLLTAMANMLLKIRFERAPETPYPLQAKKGLQTSNFEKEPLVVRLVPRQT